MNENIPMNRKEQIMKVLESNSIGTYSPDAGSNRIIEQTDFDKTADEILNLFKVYSITFHSSYAAWNHQQFVCIASAYDEALENFWKGKNKEDFQIISIITND